MKQRQHAKAELLGVQIKPGVVVLTKTQMAAALQVCTRTITKMMGRGEISYFKIGRLTRFPVDEALKRMNETVLNR